MHSSRSGQPQAPSQASSAQRARTLMVSLVVGGGLALLLATHGAWWWYAPLAMVGIVLAHVAMLGGIVFVATRGPRGCAPGSATGGQAVAGHAHHGETVQLHRPR